MILFSAATLIILMLILSLHYYQHFRFKTCQKNQKNTPRNLSASIIEAQMNLNLSPKRKFRAIWCQRCYSLRYINGDEIHFFPMIFLFYLLFTLILCILITIIEIFDYNKDIKKHHLLLGHGFQPLQSYGLLQTHHIYTSNICDYFLIYSIMILAIWQTFLSFYLYNESKNMLKFFIIPETIKTVKKFSIYLVLFSASFIIQMHLYYWMLVINIVVHCVFNFYFTYKFTWMLRYELFSNYTILSIVSNNVTILKFTFWIYYILQSTSLVIFLVIYNVHIIYYLPLLWCISCLVYIYNFEKNRIFIQHQLLKCKQSTTPLKIHIAH
eukprot:375253_1